MAERTSLGDLRKEIAEVTLQIFRLCEKRIQLARQIARVKTRCNVPIEDPQVEEELKQKVLSMCRTCGMDMGFCARLLELLLDESKRVQSTVLSSKS